MKILLSFLVFILGLAVTSAAGSETTTTVMPSETTTLSPTTTTASPETTTTTTTTSPETTTITTTTASPETTTITTASPETTTTTTASSETTTTPVPSKTTSEPPKTTAVPEPEPDTCSWNITRKNVTCIRAELKAQFIIPTEGNDTKVILGCNARSDQSECSNDTQTLVLIEPSYTLTMVFEKESDKVSVKNITLNYTLPSGQKGVVANNDKHFTVKAGNSYLCRSETKVKLENVTMDILDIQIQAFGEKDNKNFGSAEECEADDKVSDVVPIAVGVALAALIIIVLIAYLVGRRRSRQKGYQSV